MQLAAVVERDLDAADVGHDVVIREDVAAFVDDRAGAHAVDLAGRIVAGRTLGGRRDRLLALDADDGRPGLAHGADDGRHALGRDFARSCGVGGSRGRVSERNSRKACYSGTRAASVGAEVWVIGD